jgi:hypothetical protein
LLAFSDGQYLSFFKLLSGGIKLEANSPFALSVAVVSKVGISIVTIRFSAAFASHALLCLGS